MTLDTSQDILHSFNHKIYNISYRHFIWIIPNCHSPTQQGIMQNFITLGKPFWKKYSSPPKYIIVKGGGGSEIYLRVQSYSFGNWGPYAKLKNPSTTPSGRKVKFTPKYIIVGGEGGISEFLLMVQLFTGGCMQNVKSLAQSPQVEHLKNCRTLKAFNLAMGNKSM